MYTVFAINAEWGLEVRQYTRGSLAWEGWRMFGTRRGIKRVALYADGKLLVAVEGAR